MKLKDNAKRLNDLPHRPTETACKLIPERGVLCEICGVRRATEAHHCLYRRDRRVKGVLEEAYNLQLVCGFCHQSGAGDTYENRLKFWEDQCKRYGKEIMLDWHARVPYKIKNPEYK